MKKIVTSTWQYVKPGIEGSDGRFSIRRGLGTLLILSGIILTFVVSINFKEHLEAQTLLISPLFATGLLMFGITSYYQSKENQEIRTQEDIENQLAADERVHNSGN